MYTVHFLLVFNSRQAVLELLRVLLLLLLLLQCVCVCVFKILVSYDYNDDL